MNKQNELIINHDKKAAITSFFIVQPIIAVTIGLLFLLAHATQNNARTIVLSIVAQSFAWIFTAILSGSILHAIYCFFSNSPLAIVNDEGFWVKHYGFTPWDEITTIRSYSYQATQVFINIKNQSHLYKQCNWYGRFMLWLMSCMNLKPYIRLTSIDTPEDTFLEFVKPYLKQKDTQAVLNEPSELIVNYLTTYESRLIAIPLSAVILLQLSLNSMVSRLFIYTLSIIMLFQMLLRFMDSKKRLALLNKDGVTINHFGFIPWQDITTMEFYGSHLNKETFSIGICVDDLATLKKQANWIGKLKIATNQLLSRWFSSSRYHITISNRESMSATGEIMDFAQRYLPQ